MTIYAHITSDGAAHGLTPELLNKWIDRYERESSSIYDLDPMDYAVLRTRRPDQTPPSAAQMVAI